MPNKAKKLYKKAKKGIKNIVSPKKQRSGVPVKIQNPTAKVEKPPEKKQKDLEGKDLKRGISFRNSFQKAKEKMRSLRTEPKEKTIKKGGMFKKKVKSLNPIKVKKNKVIGSKKLAFLLTAGTIVAILPTFNLAPFPALAITSACVFSINFIVVKTLKKAVKQRKLAAKSKEEPTVTEPEKLEDISVEPAKKDPEQISRE
ncbi:MAG: hypothetical protein LBJ80_00480 [Rickettsiales bacterium]|jgi:hypothetical protein|nr:hypothetical protein [Rickettsiales bacterium]MDR1260888.1 hypothetical protein [Rickettsiales bacterium]